jgi:hypothetical protein
MLKWGKLPAERRRYENRRRVPLDKNEGVVKAQNS